MKNNLPVIWLLVCCATLLQAQTQTQFQGTKRSSNNIGNMRVTHQIGTLNNSSITAANLSGIQAFPLDFSAKPYLRDTALNYYEIGNIPEQNVVSGGLIDFYVKCDSLIAANKTYSISYTDTPIAPIRFYANRQEFIFTPDFYDTISFFVYFKAKSATDSITQKVRFKIYKPATIDNYSFGVGNAQQLPDANATEYQIVTTTNNPTEYFNGQNQPTRNISISAVDLYADNVAGNILMTLSGNHDIKQLNIYAERLFIRKSLYLPQTEVNIYCRQLFFDEDSGQTSSAIITTPIAPINAADYVHGVNGVQAGNINVFAGQITDNDGGIRFQLIGGDGQTATYNTGGDGGIGGTLFSNQDLFSKGDYLGGIAGNTLHFDTLATHYKGNSGSFIKDSIQLRWIHPNYIRQVLAYCNDAYFLGYGKDILPELIIYDNYLQNFTNDTVQFKALEAYSQTDLLQVHMEVITLINRIMSGLDYYANPVGWVPLLSFEFTQAAFQSELQHAMNILYLDYFISNAGNTIQRRIDGYTALANELQTQAANDENSFDDLVSNKIPEINIKIADNQQRITDIKNHIEQIANELEARADAELQSNKKPLWEKIVGGVATVCTMIPTPYTQIPGAALSSGLSLYDNLKNVDNINISNIGTIVNAVTDAGHRYSDLQNGFDATQNNWGEVGAQIQNFFPVFQGGVSYDALSEDCQRGKDLFKSLDFAVSGVQDIYNSFLDVPDPDLRKARSELMANDPTIASLNEDLKTAAEEGKQLADQFNSTNTQIQQLASEIAANALAFDNTNTKLLNNVTVLDHRTVHYIHYLRLNCLARLKKYYYYMAKAYEFRTLQPFTGNLDLAPILSSAQNMADTAGNSALNNSQFNALAALYNDQIKQLAQNTYDYYISNAPGQTITTTYVLPKKDIASLNRGEKVFFNPIVRGLFPDDEENIRIINLRVRDLKDSVGAGTIGSPVNIDVKFEYPNESYIKSQGKVYYFNNYNLNTANPLSWESRYDVGTTLITDFKPSAAVQSLLQSLCISQSLPHTNDDLLMYSRPSAGADLLLSTSSLNNGGTAGLFVDSMVVEIEYDFNNKPGNISYLELHTDPDWIVPAYKVSKPDINTMQDGQGDMIRTFITSNSNIVQVNTDSTIGGYRFERWLDRYGNRVSDQDSVNPTRAFHMGQGRFYNVKYKWAGPILVLPDTLYFNPGQTIKSLFVDNQGETDMYWKIDTASLWATVLGGIKSGYNDSLLSISVSGLVNDTIGYIKFIAPDAENAIDTVWLKYTTTGFINNVIPEVVIDLFPNPVNNELLVQSDIFATENILPLVYDIKGKLIPLSYTRRSNQVILNTTDIESGIYLIKLNIKNKQVSRKFIKF